MRGRCWLAVGRRAAAAPAAGQAQAATGSAQARQDWRQRRQTSGGGRGGSCQPAADSGRRVVSPLRCSKLHAWPSGPSSKGVLKWHDRRVHVGRGSAGHTPERNLHMPRAPGAVQVGGLGLHAFARAAVVSSSTNGHFGAQGVSLAPAVFATLARGRSYTNYPVFPPPGRPPRPHLSQPPHPSPTLSPFPRLLRPP
jgi:hypothetical protein